MNKEGLMQFEEEIKEFFLEAKIRAPIHLSRGNEEPLIEIFKEVRPEDWVFSTHRSHLHALLHGIDRQWLKQEILEGRSIHIMNAEHRFFTSAIVGGICPIAVGVAMAIKRKGEESRVYCFVGDMAAETGIFHECTKYAKNLNLPVTFVIEDNHYSTNTPTGKVWGFNDRRPPEGEISIVESWSKGQILYYRYTRKFPHQGAGQWVKF